MVRRLMFLLMTAAIASCFTSCLTAAEETAVQLTPTLHLTNPHALDQDDMCFWLHPTDLSQSTVIVSDKEANRLFVYDLSGRVLESIAIQHPGNIDVRAGFLMRDTRRSLVVVTERDDHRLAVFTVDPEERTLQRVDRGTIRTGENYGGALLHDPVTNRLDFICTSKTAGVQQIELFEEPAGVVQGRLIRQWQLPMCEGAVCDDLTGRIYVSVEQEGVYCLATRSQEVPEPQRIIRLGEGGLVGDTEGLALARIAPDQLYLIVSDQGASQFRVYDLIANGTFCGSFSVRGAQNTDGIDLNLSAFGNILPRGAFACHTDADQGRTVLVSDAGPLVELLLTR